MLIITFVVQVKEYVSTRIGLNNVCLLVDAKWGMKPGDHELINLMERFFSTLLTTIAYIYLFHPSR
jgi:GTP-binding protein EngB required for normal cell division